MQNPQENRANAGKRTFTKRLVSGSVAASWCSIWLGIHAGQAAAGPADVRPDRGPFRDRASGLPRVPGRSHPESGSMTAFLALIWSNRHAVAALSTAEVAMAAAVCVMTLRADNAALSFQIKEAERLAEEAEDGAERIRRQAEALMKSQYAAAAERADALERIRSATDACLDQPIPAELLDR